MGHPNFNGRNGPETRSVHFLVGGMRFPVYIFICAYPHISLKITISTNHEHNRNNTRSKHQRNHSFLGNPPEQEILETWLSTPGSHHIYAIGFQECSKKRAKWCSAVQKYCESNGYCKTTHTHTYTHTRAHTHTHKPPSLYPLP